MRKQQRWITDHQLTARINEDCSRTIPAGEEIEVSSWPMDGDDVRIYWEGHEEGQIGLTVPKGALEASAHRASSQVVAHS